MAHALSSHTGLGHLNAAPVTDYSLIPDLFVFTAMTFPVLAGPEYLLTEQAVSLRL